MTEAKVRPQGVWMLVTGTGPGGDTQPLLLLHPVGASVRASEAEGRAARKRKAKKKGIVLYGGGSDRQDAGSRSDVSPGTTTSGACRLTVS
jgi:hypothetical protein